MFDPIKNGLREWLVGIFAAAIKQTSRSEDRNAAIQWLLKSREILASDANTANKMRELNALINSRAAVSSIAGSISDAVKKYRTTSLPWPMKIAVPATLLAVPLVGGHGVGLAAFGSAIGLPVLLLVFLGTAGVTSVIETVATNQNSIPGIAAVVTRIMADETSRRTSNAFRTAMREQATAPKAEVMPAEESALRERLLTMDPFDFERHVMSFFDKAGLEAVVTPCSNDFGLDGYAAHPGGLIVVQCKRYATKNRVGREPLQRFKTVIADEGAFRGYIVTTSSFTLDANLYAGAAPSMMLVDMEQLVMWHQTGLTI